MYRNVNAVEIIFNKKMITIVIM